MSLKTRRILKYVFAAILTIFPLGLYTFWFWNTPISNNPDDWASFGSYIGGVYSVIVALIVVYLARDLSRKDEAAAKRKKGIEALYQQVVKIKTEHVDERSVNRIYSLLQENKLYISDSLFNEVKSLADYFLEVKGGIVVADDREERVKEHLRSLYNA